MKWFKYVVLEQKFNVEFQLCSLEQFKFIILTNFLFQCVEHYSLGNHQICDSGKFNLLDDMLPQMKENDDRVLIFTQFVMVLDIMEQYLRIRGHKYLRLDGSTAVQERYND